MIMIIIIIIIVIIIVIVIINNGNYTNTMIVMITNHLDALPRPSDDSIQLINISNNKNIHKKYTITNITSLHMFRLETLTKVIDVIKIDFVWKFQQQIIIS